MNVNLLAWAMSQALPADQLAILIAMTLLAIEANTGAIYYGNLTALAAHMLRPMLDVQQQVDALVLVGVVKPVSHGYRLQMAVVS